MKNTTMKKTTSFFKILAVLACVCTAMLSKAQSDSLSIPVTSDFTYGIYGGTGGVFPLGSIKDDFKPCVVFQIGVTGGYGNWRLKTDVHYGQPSLKNDNIYQVKDDQGRDLQHNSNTCASYFGWGMQLGYTLRASRRLSVTPSAGCYYNRYGWDVDSLKWTKDDDGKDVVRKIDTRKTHLGHFGVIASIDFDYRLSSQVTDRPFLGNGNKRFTSSVRLTPWVTYAKYGKAVPAVKGVMLGVTVNYLGLLQNLYF